MGVDRQTVSGRGELLSIIVPVCNEAATSRALIDRLLAVDLPLPREIRWYDGVRALQVLLRERFRA
jgi:hypothetical protein